MPPLLLRTLTQATQKTPDLAEVVARAGAPACLQTFMTLEAGNRDGMLAGCMIIGEALGGPPYAAGRCCWYLRME